MEIKPPYGKDAAIVEQANAQEREQNTAAQEIEIARRLIAKKLTGSLESAFVHTPESLLLLARVLEMIR